MIAAELISNIISPLEISDTVKKALEKMSEFKLYHLPILENQLFLGLVAEDELIEIKDQSLAIENLHVSIVNIFVFEDAHIYDVIKLFNQLHLSVVPVLDKNKNYLGFISINNILEYTAKIFATNEPGGIIVLGISNRNNSLAHMAQIVEADNAQILSSHVSSFADSTKLEVTLKINKTELSGIISTFERYNYEIIAVFNNDQNNNTSVDRFNSFMNYLNV